MMMLPMELRGDAHEISNHGWGRPLEDEIRNGNQSSGNAENLILTPRGFSRLSDV
jgi:hypothetical protein